MHQIVDTPELTVFLKSGDASTLGIHIVGANSYNMRLRLCPSAPEAFAVAARSSVTLNQLLNVLLTNFAYIEA